MRLIRTRMPLVAIAVLAVLIDSGQRVGAENRALAGAELAAIYGVNIPSAEIHSAVDDFRKRVDRQRNSKTLRLQLKERELQDELCPRIADLVSAETTITRVREALNTELDRQSNGNLVVFDTSKVEIWERGLFIRRMERENVPGFSYDSATGKISFVLKPIRESSGTVLPSKVIVVAEADNLQQVRQRLAYCADLEIDANRLEGAVNAHLALRTVLLRIAFSDRGAMDVPCWIAEGAANFHATYILTELIGADEARHAYKTLFLYAKIDGSIVTDDSRWSEARYRLGPDGLAFASRANALVFSIASVFGDEKLREIVKVFYANTRATLSSFRNAFHESTGRQFDDFVAQVSTEQPKS